MRPGYRWTTLAVLALACRDAAAPPPPRHPDRVDVARDYFGPPCDVFWRDPVAGFWSDSSRWDVGRVPNSWDIVCITEPGDYAVFVDLGEARRLVVGEAASRIELIELPHPWISTGNILDVGSIDLLRGAYLQLRDINSIGRIGADSGSTIAIANNTTINDLSSLSLESDIALATGANLYLNVDAGWSLGWYDDGTISGDGHVFLNSATDGEAEHFSWWSGTMGTRPNGDPIVIARGISLYIGDRAVGAIDVDPAGEPMELTGVVGPAARLRVRRSQWASPATVTFGGDIDYPLQVEGHLEILETTGLSMTLRGVLENARLMTVGPGRIVFAMDSLVNTGLVVTNDSLGMTMGGLRNAGTISLPSAAPNLTIAAGADYIAEPGGTVAGTITLAGGRLLGNGTLQRVVSSGGTVSPGGGGLGSLSFGRLTLDAGSRVVFDVRGTTPATYDDVRVNGLIGQSGTFDVRGNGSFTAGLCGQVIPLVIVTRGATTTGAFTQYSGLSVGPGRAWRAVPGSNGVLLAGYDPSRAFGLSSGSVALTEGGGGGSTVGCLGGSAAPTAPVDVRASSRFAQSTPTPAQLTFSASNWALPQTVRVDAIDDGVAEPTHLDSLRFVLSSGDPAYVGTARAQLSVSITDNDAGPDLSTSLVVSPASVGANQVFEARYRVTNNGPAASTGSTFRIAPLAGMTFVGSTPQVTCSAAAGPVQCSVSALAAGASVEFVLVYRAGAAGTYANDVSITGNEYDAVVANNVFVWNITVN